MQQLGRYRVDRRLGSGAFATVYRAFDPELQTGVAIKVLADNWVTDAHVCARFLAEARLLRRISHPAVVRVHDVGTARDDHGVERPYFVMDLIRGGTLADRQGTLHPHEALGLLAEAADAVQALHDAGTLHRDLKPSNLLVDAERASQRVVVADLGSAKALAEASVITLVTGTPAYMAPEQARGDPIDARTDVYAMGAVAHHVVTGCLPDLEAKNRGSAQRLLVSRLGLPRSFDLVVAHALAEDPRDRFASCSELAQAFRDLAENERPDLPRPPQRRWPRAAVLCVAALVFACAALLGWWST